MTFDAQETKFTDPRNITEPARVVWAEETTTLDGIRCHAGYVLPGGYRTRDKFEAQAMAVRMAGLIKSANARTGPV
jgi:hypothetical protein